MSKISRNHRDPTDDRDFRQFTRAFDRPIAPSRSFADALRQQLVQPSAPVPANHQPGRPPVTADSPPAVTFVDRRPWRVGFSILEIAATLLLISALALSAYVINAVGRPSTSIETLDGQSARLDSAATPQTLDSSAGVNWGGEEGRSQYYGDASVDTGETPSDVKIGDEGTTTVGPGLIVGDSWYGWTVRAGVDAFLRVNLATGETVWERPYRTWGTLASDGKRIFAFQVDVSDTPTPIPVALDMATGEIAWRGPALHPFATSFTVDESSIFPLDEGTPAAGAVPDVTYQPGETETISIDLTSDERGPVVAGDTVYFTDGRATTVALGTADGVERWRDDRSDDLPTVFGSGDQIHTPMGGTIVANDQYVLVRLPDDSIVSLDPATGEERGRSYKGGITDSSRIILGASLRGDRLVVLTAFSFVSADGPTFSSAVVSVLNAGSLEVLVTSDSVEGGAGFEMVVTDTSAFLLTLSEQQVPEMVEVDLTTGAVSEPFGTGQLVGQVQLSGSGDTLIAAMSSGTVLSFSMETHELLDRHRIQGGQPITLVGGPMPVVDGRPVAIWKVGPNAPFPQFPPATPLP